MKCAITGHQDLGPPDTRAWIEAQLNAYLDHAAVSHGYTCLAAGADQLFAELLVQRAIPYTAVIPCDRYETTFSTASARDAFTRLLGDATAVITMPDREPCEEAFIKASMVMVDRSDAVVAIWNGQPARGVGGTADVIAYALRRGREVRHINPLSRTATQLDAKSEPR